MQPIIPVNYKIHLEPDLINFTFSGKCDFLFEAIEPIAEVSLNILEIAIWGCRVWQTDQWLNCAFKVNPENEQLLNTLYELIRAMIMKYKKGDFCIPQHIHNT